MPEQGREYREALRETGKPPASKKRKVRPSGKGKKPEGGPKAYKAQLQEMKKLLEDTRSEMQQQIADLPGRLRRKRKQPQRQVSFASSAHGNTDSEDEFELVAQAATAGIGNGTDASNTRGTGRSVKPKQTSADLATAFLEMELGTSPAADFGH